MLFHRLSNKSETPARELYSVLIADDEPSMLATLGTALLRLGHHVVGTAADGREVVEKALRLRPDVVITDLYMPGRDGFQVARELSGVIPSAIVMSTGARDAKTIQRAVCLGVSGYLVKPFTSAQLNAALHLAVTQLRKSAVEEAALG